ncbi:bacterioferritin [Paraphotobacterium marinum]|uniref:Bacterioferritin n=1 Tax=Paraphotobacterium marinum TaxID=1755811 RepID=A0A220VDV6_9GAMM|nr:bacterioferritin [Paraphotobacterium marinum]ASK78598.1 bacterioferritin [Paraphotobacterium marinum]
MTENQNIIIALNKILTVELTSINQYFLHARIFKHWGLEGLNSKEYKKSILDMKQADRLIERILFLGGLPNLQLLNKVNIGEDTEEIIQADLELENSELTLLKQVIQACEDAKDFVSRDIIEKILEEEEEYYDWLIVQQELIGNINIKNYQQSMMEK